MYTVEEQERKVLTVDIELMSVVVSLCTRYKKVLTVDIELMSVVVSLCTRYKKVRYSLSSNG